MDSMLRRLKLRRSESRESDARKSLQEDLYEYSQFSGFGFPSKPSAIAHDPYLDLLAIGTKSGALKLYGQPGICLQGQHKGDVAVGHIIFVPRQSKLVTICSDNSLHLWELSLTKEQHSFLEKKKSFTTESSRLKTISSCCLLSHENHLLLGTEGGNVHFFDVTTFTLSDRTISHDLIAQGSNDQTVDGEDFKFGPGAAECICQHPRDRTKVLIGFSHGLIVLCNLDENTLTRTFNSMQTLEYLTFVRGGEEFVSSHADGSYIVWRTADSSMPKEPATAPYGPFPCKSITKLLWKSTNADPFIVFSGGMPRASYGDRYTITVMHGDSHVVLDFTSKVVDFIVLCNADRHSETEVTEGDSLHSIIVLAEEELVAVDMTSNGWPLFRLPYLVSLHCSVITCIDHVSNVPEVLWNKIVDAGNLQLTQYSSRDWPICGARMLQQKNNKRDLLLTGHEDGSVNFWDVSLDGAIRLLHKLTTANLFGIDTLMHCDGSGDSELYDEWPPFRKVGIFDPFTDDPRLAIQKIHFCLLSETFVVAGTAGQIVMFQHEREERDHDVRTATINIVSDRENFTWRGHNALEVKNSESKLVPGFQPVCVIQMLPPVPCTALAFQPEWQLLAIGTAYGVGLFDYARCKTVHAKCTFASYSGGSGEGVTLSRRKSFQKMVRQSLRRLRGRSSDIHQTPVELNQDKEIDSKSPPVQPDVSLHEDMKLTTLRGSQRKDPTASTSSTATTDTGGSRSSQTLTSVVRCLHFAQIFLQNTQVLSASLWMGTNHGSVSIYQLTVPTNDRRTQDTVQCTLAKEIRLRHGAPVVSIQVLDHVGQPLPRPLEVQHERAKAADMTGSHYVVICSQQQLKVFSLPSLKPYHKFKLPAHKQGVQLSNIAYASFRSKKDEAYVETDAISLTTDGEMCVFTIPQLRHQLSHNVIPRENSSGISGCVFTPNGMGFFLCSPSELERFSLSARFPSTVVCSVQLSDVPESSVAVADGSVAQERTNEDVTDASENRDNLHDLEDRGHTEDEHHASENVTESQTSQQQSSTDATTANEISAMSANTETTNAVNAISHSVTVTSGAAVDSITATENSAADNTSSVSPRVESVTCASVISIPFSTKVVKADIHDPPSKGNLKQLDDVYVLKELNYMSTPTTDCVAGK